METKSRTQSMNQPPSLFDALGTEPKRFRKYCCFTTNCSKILFKYSLVFSTIITLNTQTFCLRVVEKDLETVNKVCPVERITANADTQGLTKSRQRSLMNSFIGQRSRTRHDA